MQLGRSLCTPVPAIFDAAECLLNAVECHRTGDDGNASKYLRMADSQEVRAYVENAWGKGSFARYGFTHVANPAPRLLVHERPKPRMPDRMTRKAAIERDGYHCRFCGIPVIDATLRALIVQAYPAAVTWGHSNASQHAAFQCMWLQFDHILPNSRGGRSSIDNIVVTCAPCNFGRMDTTLEEARLIDPLTIDPPIAWDHHAVWDGLETSRTHLRA